MTQEIPKTQTVALVRAQGLPIEFDSNYPVPTPTSSEVLVKILYSGVCQSDLHTKDGTATGPDGKPITNIKLPHIGGHEGVGRVISHPDADKSVKEGTLVGVRFISRICHECEYCTTDREQHCAKSTNHLHHEDGSFQEYIALNSKYLTVLPDDVDPVVVGPVLCAGVTAYKAVKNAGLKKGEWLVVVGAGGGLGHFAVQYGIAMGAKVLGVDAGKAKQEFIEGFGAKFLDFTQTKDLVGDVHRITDGGAHAAVVTSGHPQAFNSAADMLRIGGALSMVGIPPGDVSLDTPIAAIVIKGLKIMGNLIGSMTETMEAVELVRSGKVKPHVQVREFKELPEVYEMLEKGDIPGRIVLRIGSN